jgi:hypothetical protein
MAAEAIESKRFLGAVLELEAADVGRGLPTEDGMLKQRTLSNCIGE